LIKLSFGRFVGPADVERRLIGISPATKESKGWTKETKENGILIDLSKTEFAEFSALAQLALIVEGAARHKIRVTVALPISEVRPGEAEFIRKCTIENNLPLADAARRRVRRRQSALRFMEHCGFISAVAITHVPNHHDYVTITRSFQQDIINSSRPAEIPEDGFDLSEPQEYLLRQIFPLRWLAIENEDLSINDSFAAAVMGLAELGITRGDAQAIVGTILHELVENVARHAPEDLTTIACPPRALVGALLLNPDFYEINQKHFRPLMNNFVSYSSTARSPFLRIVVGDSGVGVQRRLAPYWTAANHSEVPSLEPPLNESEAVLFWSLNKWSTSDRSTDRHLRGTRGLWLVQRFVRAYHGAMTLRSDNVIVGWSYEEQAPVPLRDRGLRYLPGTMLEVCLLPHIPQAQVLNALQRPADVQFRSIFLGDNGGSGISDVQRTKLVTELAQSTPDVHICVMAVLDSIPATARHAQSLFCSIVHTAGDLANHGAIVAILTNIFFVQIEAAKESLELEEFQTNPDRIKNTGLPLSLEPVLLIDASGEGKWLAPGEILPPLLNQLTAKQSLRLEELQWSGLVDPPPSFEFVYRVLRDRPDIFKMTDGRVELRFRTADVLSAFVHNITSILKTAISQGGEPGITHGKFRTPTLQCVTTWIDVPTLIARSIGVPAAMFALSRRVTDLLQIGTDTWLIKLDSVHADMVQQLSMHLGLQSRIWSVPRTLGSFDTTDWSRMLQGTGVLVFADLILTSNAVRRVATDLVRSNARPLAIVCVFDARKERGPIVCLGKSLPVISLAEIDVCCEEPPRARLTNIDPVLRQPLTRGLGLSRVDHEIKPHRLFRWCTNVDKSLVIGHIQRSTRRHFNIYLNAARLFQLGSPYRKDIVDAFIKQLHLWYQEATQQSRISSIEIWVPKSDQFAKEIAIALSEAIKQQIAHLFVVPTREIPRAENGDKWIFPVEVDSVREDTAVLIVDWGSLTATTTHQLMRLAAQAAASAIWTIVFLSQMSNEEETALRQIASITSAESFRAHGPNGIGQMNLGFRPDHDSANAKTRPVHARATFLSALNITFYTSADCPICRVRDLYARASQEAPTPFLRDYAKEMAQLLTEIEREDAFRRPLQDLFEVPVTTREITVLLGLRSHLQRALTNTEERAALRKKLTIYAKNKNIDVKVKTKWIRLLAAEDIWLNVPPLSFFEIRADIATISMSVITDELLHEGVRRQAIAVLRAASKETFVQQLFTIFINCVRSRVLIAELLFDVWTYLARPYHDTPETLSTLCTNLQKSSDYLSPKGPMEPQQSLQVQSAIAYLIRAAEALRTTVAVRDLLPIEIWRTLRTRFLGRLEQTHPDAVSNYNVVILGLRALWAKKQPPERERLQRIAEAWDRCLSFLQSYLLPHLRLLPYLLLSDVYENLTDEDLGRLEQLISDETAVYIDRVADMLAQFLVDPSTAMIDRNRGALLKELQWWNRMFLRIDPRGGREDSWLIRILHRCPCDLASAVRGAVDDTKATGAEMQMTEPSTKSIDVFCDADVLRETVRHILENAVGTKHALPGRTTIPQVSITMSEDTDFITLVVLNTGTFVDRNQVIGTGTPPWKQKLQAFGAEIVGREAIAPWTFEATVRIRRW
jgi:signal transduction histidine kinase